MSLSRLALIDRIPAATKVSLLVGGDDPTTPPNLTLTYADALRNRGVAVDVTVSPGLGHNILLEPVAMDRLKQIVSALGASR